MTVYTATSKDIVFKETTTILTDEQIKNLPISAVELVAPQGANKIIMMHWAVIHRPTFTTGYAGMGANDSIRIQYHQGFGYIDKGVFNTDRNNGDLPDITNLLTAGGISVNDAVIYDASDNSILPVADISNISNKAIEVQMYTDGGEPFTGGDAANTIKITVLYSILEF